ncbi:unnamed protein product [Gemmata massiliana]|uniref:Uncharacterized protein n=1 Tax=Gemmata massiliana TaxID=1210884 RepID=A0A6P2D1J3_9BACT|nr:hypothetical protein [Gemmata massiliana]VTR95141.1 unnamed protein product [Gemmata massiliana]
MRARLGRAPRDPPGGREEVVRAPERVAVVQVHHHERVPGAPGVRQGAAQDAQQVAGSKVVGLERESGPLLVGRLLFTGVDSAQGKPAAAQVCGGGPQFIELVIDRHVL